MGNLGRNTHERLSAAQDIRGSSDRSFGIVMAVVFTVIGVWPLLSGGMVRWWALIAAALFCSLAFLRPALLAPLNRLWFRFGLLLKSPFEDAVILTMDGVGEWATTSVGLGNGNHLETVIQMRWGRKLSRRKFSNLSRGIKSSSNAKGP